MRWNGRERSGKQDFVRSLCCFVGELWDAARTEGPKERNWKGELWSLCHLDTILDLVPVSAHVSLMNRVVSSSLQQLRDSVKVPACGTQKSTIPVCWCSSISPTKMADLRKLMNSLPQELYDEIYDFTFGALVAEMRSSPNAQGTIRMFTGRRTPTILQIDQASRAEFAKEYYSLGNFKFRNALAASRFLNLIGAQQRKLLEKDIVVMVALTEVDRPTYRIDTIKRSKDHAAYLNAFVEGWRTRYGMDLPRMVWFEMPSCRRHHAGALGYNLSEGSTSRMEDRGLVEGRIDEWISRWIAAAVRAARYQYRRFCPE